MIVIDASLATKLVIREADTDVARAWFGDLDDDVVAPDLITIEVAQAVVRRVNAREITLAEGTRIIEAWRAILENGGIAPLRITPAQVTAAASLAMSLGHPVKDCIYLVLAIAHAAALATCDAKFANRARDTYPAITLLSDYVA